MTNKNASYGPVIRLNDFLQTIKRAPSNSIGLHLAELQDFEFSDTYAVNRAYAELSLLVRQAKNEILNHEGAVQMLHIDPIEHVEKTFAVMTVKNSAGDFISNITNENLLRMQYCVHLVQSAPGEKPIPTEEILDLLETVNALIREVLNAALPAELKNFLFEQLNRIHHALTSYHINGVKGLKNAAEQTVGGIRLADESVKRAAEKDENWKHVNNLWLVISKIGTLVSLGYNIPKLALTAEKWFSIDIPGV